MSDLKTIGQEQSLAGASEQTRTDFLRIVCTLPPRSVCSVNEIHDLLHHADIPNRRRGGLFRFAVTRGYLRPALHPDGTPRLIPSEAPSAHRAYVRVYIRTDKEVSPCPGSEP